MKQPIKMTPGDELHLTALMAPFSLNLVTGQDRQHLLGYGRAAFEAGKAGQCLHQIQEPAAAPGAVAVPDFEEWRKREYPWLGPIGDRVQIAREAWSAALAATPAAAAPWLTAPPLTPDEARQAARTARLMNGPSDTTQPHEYAMAEALALAAKIAQAASAAAPVIDWEAAAEKIAIEVAKNCGTVPNLTHPYIYLGLKELFAGATAAAAPVDKSPELQGSMVDKTVNLQGAAAAPVVLPEPEHDDAYTRRVIEALHENGDPVSVDAAEEIERLRALLATATGLPAQAAEQAPVLYVSKGQLDHHRDPDGPDSFNAGRYLPSRITPAGKFTTPLFAAPQAQADARDAWPKHGDLVRYASGPTALALHGEPHVGGWHGTQCMGGHTFYTKTQPPSAEDRVMWVRCAVHYRGRTMDEARIEAGLSPIAAQADARDTAITWPKARDVGRIGDMSPTAHIRVGFDSDNDVLVSVWDENGGGSIEFCNPGGGGGGQSSRTRMALIALMVAMEADNAEKPSRDWWGQRAAIAAAKGE